MTTTNFHKSNFGSFSGFRTDLGGFVFTDLAEAKRFGDWESGCDDEYLADICSHNASALKEAEATVDSFRQPRPQPENAIGSEWYYSGSW